MEWILFFFSFEMGIITDSTVAIEPDRYAYENSFFIEVSPEIDLFGFITIYGTVRIDMFKDVSFYFNPVLLGSLIGVSLNYRGFSIRAEHFCKHPVIAWNDASLPGQNENSWYESISISYNSRR